MLVWSRPFMVKESSAQQRIFGFPPSTLAKLPAGASGDACPSCDMTSRCWEDDVAIHFVLTGTQPPRSSVTYP